VDDGYDIWGGENDNDSNDSDSVMSMIDIPEFPEVI